MKTVGFKRLVSHDRAREAVNRFCNAYLNRHPQMQRPQISIPANEDDDDMVLMDYIAQRRTAEQLPMRLLERLCDGLTRMISGDRTGPSAQHMLEWVEQVRDEDNHSSITAQEFYEAHATNIVNVPRVGHPEDKSGWDGVRRASEARFIAQDVLVMTLPDAFDLAEKYAAAAKGKL